MRLTAPTKQSPLIHRIIVISATMTIVMGAVFVVTRLPDTVVRQRLDAQRLTDAQKMEIAIEAYLVEQANAMIINHSSSASPSVQ